MTAHRKADIWCTFKRLDLWFWRNSQDVSFCLFAWLMRTLIRLFGQDTWWEKCIDTSLLSSHSLSFCLSFSIFKYHQTTVVSHTFSILSYSLSHFVGIFLSFESPFSCFSSSPKERYFLVNMSCSVNIFLKRNCFFRSLHFPLRSFNWESYEMWFYWNYFLLKLFFDNHFFPAPIFLSLKFPPTPFWTCNWEILLLFSNRFFSTSLSLLINR